MTSITGVLAFYVRQTSLVQRRAVSCNLGPADHIEIDIQSMMTNRTVDKIIKNILNGNLCHELTNN